MDVSVASRLGNLSKYLYNPAAIQAQAVALVPAILNGEIQLCDPSNPVAMCLENSAVNTAAWAIEDAVLTRQTYAAAAQTIDDIYPHMSDKDFVDRFAVPTTAKFLFVYNYDEILNKLVVDPSNTGEKKIVIPRNTFVTVNDDVVFSLQYPIEIRQMAHGGLQIVYDVSVTSPLQTLSTNLVSWKIISNNAGGVVTKLLMLEVEMTQFFINSVKAPINQATGFATKIPLTDSFYFCRVYVNNGDGTYTEMKTTHTEEIYDPAQLTAVLKVLDSNLLVKIPQVYLTTGMLNKSIRIDVYETRGVLSLNLSTYQPTQFVATYEALNTSENDQFSAPLQTLAVNYILSTELVNGGRAALSFTELRQRVITNAIGDVNIPITPAQVSASLSNQGYTLVKNIDNITNRNYLATRPMPDPQASELITAAAAGICTLSTSIQAALTVSTVVDNGDIVTIRPETLYKNVNGVAQLVPDSEVQMLAVMSPDQKALTVNNTNYMYSPFYYVLDSSGNEFNVRPYHLDTPLIETKSFIAENDTTLLQVTTDQYSIMRTTTGYLVEIQTASSDEWKALPDNEVFVQLAFIPKGDVDRAYVKGVLVGKSDKGERIYHFAFDTTWQINAQNEMQMSSFLMFNDAPRHVDLPLLTDFDVLYSTTTPKGPQWVMSPIDSILGYFDLPQNAYAITRENLNIRLGYHLDSLWARARTVVGDAQFEKWSVDVPATYTRDVYQIDPQSGAAFHIDTNGNLQFNIIHHAGDPVLDAQGQPVMLHHVGDIKLDAYGNPIVQQTRNLVRQMDLFLIEGAYYFATNQVTADYRDFLRAQVVEWLTQDFPEMEVNMLEETNLFYYPTTSLGQVRVLFANGLETTLEAGQTFEFNLYVNNAVYNDYNLRAALEKNTVIVTSGQLEERVVSMSNIVDALKNSYKNDVISIEASGLGGSRNFNVVTIVDDAQRLSLRKVLITRDDESLALKEGISVTFILHERTDIS